MLFLKVEILAWMNIDFLLQFLEMQGTKMVVNYDTKWWIKSSF